MLNSRVLKTSIVFLIVVWTASAARAQESKEYTTAQGDVVFLPLGDLSFADRSVEFNPGDPKPDSLYLHASQILGPPD